MKYYYLRVFTDKTLAHHASLFCFALCCCFFLAGQAETVHASADLGRIRGTAADRENLFNELNQKFANCDRSKSLIDRLSEKRGPLREFYERERQTSFLVGTDNCPGTNIPAGTSFTDSDTTVGANDTVHVVNASCLTFNTMAGPDKVYKFILPALGSRIAACTAKVTPSAAYDTGIYILSQSGGGCPGGTGNNVTNCVQGKDSGIGVGSSETIQDPQFDAMPAGTYYLFVDSFYCGSEGSVCNGPTGINECPTGNPNCQSGTYTLNFDCTTLSPTAALAGVGGRVTKAGGQGIGKARISVVLPSGEFKFAVTNQFGFYHFDDIEVGRSYVFQVSAKGYTFSNPTQLITVNDGIENLNFVADRQAKPARN